MTTFAVTDPDQTIGAVNYLLSNLNQSYGNGNVTIPANVLVANTTTGVITEYGSITSTPISYLYQYINIRYADSADGSVNFSSSPTNRFYFGVYNSASSAASANPAAYTWYQATGGFGTTKFLFYATNGGRQIQFAVATGSPSPIYAQTQDGVAIDLNIVSSASVTPTPRSPMPQAFILVPSDPNTASAATLTAWFSSPRTNPTAPIGTGLSPVTGDTATFIWAAGPSTATYSFDGSAWSTSVTQLMSGNLIVNNTITGNQIQANTITGNNIQTNTLTANLINVSGLTVNTVESIGSNIGNLSATGFWLDGNTGNAYFGNSVTIGSQLTVGTLISNSSLAVNTVGTTQLINGSITTDKFTANSINANILQAGTITANLLAANVLVANTVVSDGANIGNFSSNGFWLQGNTGNARFGGYVSIGNRLTVDGLITLNVLNASTVETQTIVNQAVTNLQTGVPDYPGTYSVPFYNGSNAWPTNTRGFAISGGTTIVPSTTGSAGGSKIVVSYNAQVYTTNPTYNCVELWKGATSQTYDQYYLTGAALYNTSSIYNFTGNITFTGYYGTRITSSDYGATWTKTTGGPNVVIETTQYCGDSAGSQQTLSGSPSGNIYTNITSLTGTANPAYNIYGGCGFYTGDNTEKTNIIVGATGLINFVRTPSTSGNVTTYNFTQSIPNDLYDAAQNYSPQSLGIGTISTPRTVVVVGSAGIILKGQFYLNAASPYVPTQVGSWTTATNAYSNTLYGVDCNWTNYSGSGFIFPTEGGRFVAVGQGGIILVSNDSGTTWSRVTSPTTQNLRSVSFQHNNTNKSSITSADGYWVAVGDAGTIIVSSDGTASSWTLVSSLPVPSNADVRQLNTIVYSNNGSNNYWNTAGTAIAYRSTVAQPSLGTNWTKTYDPGPVGTSSLTRLAFFGSSTDINSVAQPSNAAQINNQSIYSTYTDVDYEAGVAQTYYLVVGNLAGNAITTQNPTVSVTELKR